jgi:IPT/TIG domain
MRMISAPMSHRRISACCSLVLTLAVACRSSSSPAPTAGSSGSSPPPDESASDALAAETPVDATPVLRVTSIEPAKGDVEGGTYVVIKGERFLKDGPRSAKVYFGARQGAVVRFQSDGELIVEAPGGKPEETVDVLVVFEPGGQMTLAKAFTFVEK